VPLDDGTVLPVTGSKPPTSADGKSEDGVTVTEGVNQTPPLLNQLEMSLIMGVWTGMAIVGLGPLSL